MPPLGDPLRAALAGRVRRLVGSGEVDLSRPPGDPGLIAPGSPAWRVHGDFSAMMVGGISALLLQMLHPLALAGVWDFSDFRRDRLGRLKRTARFIAVTTFGSTQSATAAIAQVRSIHDGVHGTLPNGTPYSANDPHLLTWIHVAEVDSFLRAHLRYRDRAMSGADQDRYLADTASIARRLGACDVPETRRDVAAYYERLRPELRHDHRTRETAAALLVSGEDAATSAGMGLATAAAVELLPPWAATMHGRSTPALLRPAIRAGAGGMAGVIRWALSRPR